MFAARGFGIGETIRQYYGTLVYRNLVNEKQKWKAYGNGIMSVTVQKFIKWAIRLSDKVTDEIGMEQTAWKVPALFSAKMYVNDAKYLVGDRTPVEEKKYNPIKTLLFSNKQSVQIFH